MAIAQRELIRFLCSAKKKKKRSKNTANGQLPLGDAHAGNHGSCIQKGMVVKPDKVLCCMFLFSFLALTVH